jgi:hypothetical protein
MRLKTDLPRCPRPHKWERKKHGLITHVGSLSLAVSLISSQLSLIPRMRSISKYSRKCRKRMIPIAQDSALSPMTLASKEAFQLGLSELMEILKNMQVLTQPTLCNNILLSLQSLSSGLVLKLISHPEDLLKSTLVMVKNMKILLTTPSVTQSCVRIPWKEKVMMNPTLLLSSSPEKKPRSRQLL